jgi:hypothetical protein
MINIPNNENIVEEDYEDDYIYDCNLENLSDVKLIKNNVIYNMSNGMEYEKKPEKFEELNLTHIELKNMEDEMLLHFDDIEISIEKIAGYFKLTIKDKIENKIIGNVEFNIYHAWQCVGLSPSKRYVCFRQSREVVLYDFKKSKYMKLYEHDGGYPLFENVGGYDYIYEYDGEFEICEEEFEFYSYNKNGKESIIVKFCDNGDYMLIGDDDEEDEDEEEKDKKILCLPKKDAMIEI